VPISVDSQDRFPCCHTVRWQSRHGANHKIARLSLDLVVMVVLYEAELVQHIKLHSFDMIFQVVLICSD
jgi:hypothetical protein